MKNILEFVGPDKPLDIIKYKHLYKPIGHSICGVPFGLWTIKTTSYHCLEYMEHYPNCHIADDTNTVATIPITKLGIVFNCDKKLTPTVYRRTKYCYERNIINDKKCVILMHKYKHIHNFEYYNVGYQAAIINLLKKNKKKISISTRHLNNKILKEKRFIVKKFV